MAVFLKGKMELIDHYQNIPLPGADAVLRHPLHPPLQFMPEYVQQSVLQVQYEIQSPGALIISSMLSTISLACQDQGLVKHPSGQKSPISLYFITIAESGERKTATDVRLMESIRKFQERLDEQYSQKKSVYIFENEIWEKRKKSIDKALNKEISKNFNPEDLSFGNLISQARALLKSKPQAPHGIKLRIENTTPAAFVRFFEKNHPSTSIISDEGLAALTSFATSNIGNLNNAWNGRSIHVERISSESFSVKEPRLTIHLMFQPGVFKSVIENDRNIWHESGFLARALFSFPKSNIGIRTYSTASLSPVFEHGMSEFNRRISQILEDSYLKKGNARKEFYFSSTSKGMWSRYAEFVEQEMGEGGSLEEIKSFASKILENIARIAALLHCLELNEKEEIGGDNMLRALEIGHWYLYEHRRFFGSKKVIPDIERNARLLWDWMQKRSRSSGAGGMIEKKLIAKIASPHFLRHARIWQPALDWLEVNGHVALDLNATEEYVILNPNYISY